MGGGSRSTLVASPGGVLTHRCSTGRFQICGCSEASHSLITAPTVGSTRNTLAGPLVRVQLFLTGSFHKSLQRWALRSSCTRLKIPSRFVLDSTPKAADRQHLPPASAEAWLGGNWPTVVHTECRRVSLHLTHTHPNNRQALTASFQRALCSQPDEHSHQFPVARGRTLLPPPPHHGGQQPPALMENKGEKVQQTQSQTTALSTLFF